MRSCVTVHLSSNFFVYKLDWAELRICLYMYVQMVVHSCKHNPSLLCVAVSLFSNGGFDNRCHTRKQIIIKLTEWSSDNTKDQHWHINTVEGHCTITVYGPAPAQLPPLESSIITTPSSATPVTLDLFTQRLCNNAAKKSPVYGTFVFHAKESIAITRRPHFVGACVTSVAHALCQISVSALGVYQLSNLTFEHFWLFLS